MRLIPTSTNVVVRLGKTSSTTASGIHIPAAYQNDEPSVGHVVAIGPDVKLTLDTGTKVAYRTTKNLTVVRDAKETAFIIMDENDVLAVVVED